MAGGGYTPAEISAFLISDINAIYEAWRDNPPVNELLAAFMGVKPKPKPSPAFATATTGSSIAAIRAAYPDGLMRG